MPAKIASLLISLGLESGAFKSGLTAAEKDLKAATRRIENVGKSMQGVGQKLSLAVSLPLIALGKTAVTAAIESRDAIASVEATLKSVGAAAGKTSAQLSSLAETGMRASLFDDDEILRKVTTSLLTFDKVSGQTFDRAQQAAIDLSAKFGGDLQSSALMVGKALQDPVKGITALTRAGISFTDQQKAQIKQMVAVGDAAGAQKLIMAELEKQVKGSAAAARKANPFAALKQSFAEFQETVGDKLLNILPNIIAPIERILTAFSNFSPGMQQAIVTVGVFAVALGPLLTVLGSLVTLTAGFTGAISVIAASGGAAAAASAGFAGLAATFGPFLIGAAAVAVAGTLIYNNWDQIKDAFKPVVAELNALYEGFKKIDGVRKSPETKDAEGWYSVGKSLRYVSDQLDAAANAFDKYNAEQGAKNKLYWEAWGLAISKALTGFKEFSEAVPQALERMVARIGTAISTTLAAVWKGALDKIETVKKAFFGLYDAVVGNSYIPDMVDGIAREMARLEAVMVDPATKATRKTTEAFRKLAQDVAPILDRLFPDAAARNVFNKEFAAIESAAGAGAISRDTKNQALDALGGENAANAPDAPPLDPAFDVGPLEVNLGGILDQLKQVEIATGSVTSKWGEWGEAATTAYETISYQLKGVLLGAQSLGDALRNIINKLASKVLDGFFNSIGKAIGIPGFAGGTSFAPGGLAMVGERGPELVNLPRGSQVTPANDTARMLGQRGGDSYHISVSGPMSERDARATGRQIADAISGQQQRARRFGIAT